MFIIDQAGDGTRGPDVSPDHPIKKKYPAAYLLVSKGKLWWVLENSENKIEQITDEHGNPLTWKTPPHGQPTSVEPIFETDPRIGQQQQKPEPSAQQADGAQVQQVLSSEAFSALAQQMNKLGISVENASASSRSVTFGSQIEKFDGSRPEKLREWLRSVEKFASLSNTAPLDMAYMASKDHVSTFLGKYKEVNKGWTACKEELKAWFGQVVDKHHAQQLLTRCRQGRLNVQMYSQKLEELAQDVWSQSELQSTVAQRQLLNIFIEGLTNPAIRKKLMRSRAASFHEAVKLATEEQNLEIRFNLREGSRPGLARSGSRSNGYRLDEDDNIVMPPGPMYVDQYPGEEDMDTIEAPINRVRNRQRSNRIRCYKCHKFGHKRDECYRNRRVMEVKRVAQGQQGHGGQGQGQVRGETRTCYLCQKKGHLRRNCPDLQNQGQGQGQGRPRFQGQGRPQPQLAPTLPQHPQPLMSTMVPGCYYQCTSEGKLVPAWPQGQGQQGSSNPVA